MKVVVTGAAGFIGSSLSEALLKNPEVTSVIGIDCLTDYYDVALKRANLDLVRDERFTFQEIDIMSPDVANAIDGADFIFHQAGQPGVRGSWGSEFDLYTSRNILATQRLLELAKLSKNLKGFIYASSSSVYGNASRYPTLETDLPQPVSPYGVSKLSAEHLCTLYANNFAVPAVSLRYFTVYGPRQRPDMLFKRLAIAARTGVSLQIFGDGTQIRDFTFVDDVVEANVLFMKTPFNPGAVFNVSGGTNVSVNEVVETLSAISGRSVPVEYGARVPGDVGRTGGSAEQLRAATGWSPKTSLADGLAAMWNFELSQAGL